MNRTVKLSLALLLVAIASVGMSALSQTKTADNLRPQLKTRPPIAEWNVDVDSADISPDGNLVASAFFAEAASIDEWTRTVRIWSPADNRIVGEFRLGTFEARQPYLNSEHMLVRFGHDGHLLYVYLQGELFVLNLLNIDDVKQIPLYKPPDTVIRVGGRLVTNRATVKAMELSPSGDAIAVLWSAELASGAAKVYRLPTGSLVATIPTPQIFRAGQHSMCWSADGKSLLIAVPSYFNAEHANNEPNVYMFDALTGTLLKGFATELVTTSIAVSRDRLFAVDSGEVGLVSNHHPKMKVFDLETGKLTAQVEGGESGVRFVVASAKNADVIAAFTGTIKVAFDWGDLQSYWFPQDTTFTLWNSTNLKPQFVSPKIEEFGDLRFSADGKKLLLYGNMLRFQFAPGKSLRVFSLP